MKYLVNIGYKTFEFENSEVAIAFAIMAKEHYVAKNQYDDSDIDVGVDIINNKEQEAE